MNKITILYFSGTGNTEKIANLYRDALLKMGDDVQAIKMEDFLRDTTIINWGDVDRLGIAYPIHAFNAPRIVHDTVRKLPQGKNLPTFLFCAGGGYSPTNDGALFIIREKLLRKGYRVYHEAMFLTATNFIVSTPDSDTRKLFQVAKEKIDLYAEEIHNDVKRLRKVPEWNRIFSKAMLIEHLGARLLGRYHYYANIDCHLCKKCIQICPMGNIRNDNGYIKFGNNCVLCMRCIYSCPANAIRVKILPFVAIKNGFNLDKVLIETNDSDTFMRNSEDAFYRRNRKYIDEK